MPTDSGSPVADTQARPDSGSPRRRRILLVSNGYGEDRVAAAIARRWDRSGSDLLALPIVGHGNAYRALDIPVIGPTAALPSGGFILHSRPALLGDLASGLASLTLRQVRALLQISPTLDLVVAVGDLVPLALAWLSKALYVLVGCAKSDYYVGGRFSDYFPHERWLLRQPRCLAVYPRDALTARNLADRGYRAYFLGNPMMDDLEPASDASEPARGSVEIGLLPGSRDEAYANFRELLRCCQAIAARRPAQDRVVFRAAVADSLDAGRIRADARASGWVPAADGAALRGPAGEEVQLCFGAFGDWCRSLTAVVGLAGTANEQCVGLGLPVVTFPGKGPQFDARFALRQARLLGESIVVAEPRPEAVAEALWGILGDPDRLARLSASGRERMGPPGASQRIAEHIRGLLAGADDMGKTNS